MASSRTYLDHNATTPLAEAVIDSMADALRVTFGNASSIHSEGQQARHLVERARREVAQLLHAEPREIVFTSGGTEANNMAIRGFLAATGKTKQHFITTTIEHPAVLQVATHLESQGVEVTYVAVGPAGVLNPADLRDALRPETTLVSVMHANNEVGTVQPIAEIAAICHEHGAKLHVDAVQSCGKIPVDVRALDVDLLSVSAHKFHGPKGIGALYMRKGVAANPLLHGGRHERGRRPGTENVVAIHGMGIAAALARQSLESETLRLTQLRDQMEEAILPAIPDVSVNCQSSLRLPNTSSLCFHGIEGEPLLIALDLRGFAVSSGSACSSGSVEPSHVLTAIGLAREEARSCLRISLGAGNDQGQLERFVVVLEQTVCQLRKIAAPASPSVPGIAAISAKRNTP